jgi:hypothetical protein
MNCKFYVVFSKNIGGYFCHIDDSIIQYHLRIGRAEELLSILTEENVAVQLLITFCICFETTVAVGPSVFNPFVAHLLCFLDTNHSYLVGKILTFVKVWCGQYLSQTFKRFINIPI